VYDDVRTVDLARGRKPRPSGPKDVAQRVPARHDFADRLGPGGAEAPGRPAGRERPHAKGGELVHYLGRK
jgi:hypothetical protein